MIVWDCGWIARDKISAVFEKGGVAKFNDRPHSFIQQPASNDRTNFFIGSTSDNASLGHLVAEIDWSYCG